MPRATSGFKERICKWCGKPIEPPYSNNHQYTHEGDCRTEYHRKLRRDWDNTHERKPYKKTPMAESVKIRNRLKRHGIELGPHDVIVSKEILDLILAGKKRVNRLEKLKEKRAAKAARLAPSLPGTTASKPAARVRTGAGFGSVEESAVVDESVDAWPKTR